MASLAALLVPQKLLAALHGALVARDLAAALFSDLAVFLLTLLYARSS